MSDALPGGSNMRDQLDDSFDALVHRLLEENHIPGLSVGLVHNEHIETKGYGLSRLPSTVATPDTLYLTGSTTKAFTAAAIGKIIHDQSGQFPKVKWTTPLRDILKEDFVLGDECATSHVTIEDALSHRSGLPGHDASYGWGNASITDTIRSLRYFPLSAEPRTKWQYNNIMYTAVQAAIERLTGLGLGEVLEQWLWRPLGMLSTTFSLQRAQEWKDSAGVPRLARDYVLWMKALLDTFAGAHTTSPAISKGLCDDLINPRSIIPTFILLSVSIGSRNVISHAGGLIGFGSTLHVLPEAGLAFVTMGNTMGTSNSVGDSLFIEVLRRLDLYQPRSESTAIALERQFAASMELNGPGSGESKQPGERDAPVESLPGDMHEYLGRYSHPAYGEYTVILASTALHTAKETDATAQQPLHSPDSALILDVKPSERTWPQHYRLTHQRASAFELAIFYRHGAEDMPGGDSEGSPTAGGRALRCKAEVVMELLYKAAASFERGYDGSVARLGMELSAEMAESEAAQRDPRARMTWFERVA